MLKCTECPVKQNGKQKKSIAHIQQDMDTLKSVVDEFGYVDKEVKQTVADQLGVSIRQVEKYNKLLKSQGGDPKEAVSFISSKGSLNKALKSIKPPSEEKELLRDFKRYRKKYTKLQYKEFVAFLENHK